MNSGLACLPEKTQLVFALGAEVANPAIQQPVSIIGVNRGVGKKQ